MCGKRQLVGLDLMAKAGFNPEQSVSLWQNMSAAGSSGTPEFMSTHPAPGNRKNRTAFPGPLDRPSNQPPLEPGRELVVLPAMATEV